MLSVSFRKLIFHSIGLNYSTTNSQSDRPQYSAGRGNSADSPSQPNASAVNSPQPKHSAATWSPKLFLEPKFSCVLHTRHFSSFRSLALSRFRGLKIEFYFGQNFTRSSGEVWSHQNQTDIKLSSSRNSTNTLEKGFNPQNPNQGQPASETNKKKPFIQFMLALRV